MKVAALALSLGCLLVSALQAQEQRGVPVPPVRPDTQAKPLAPDNPASHQRTRPRGGRGAPDKPEGPDNAETGGKAGGREKGRAGGRDAGQSEDEPAAVEPAPTEPTAEPPAAESPPSEPEVQRIVVSPDLACRERLQHLGVTFKPVERIASGACGIEAPVAVSGLAHGVEVSPTVTMTCEGAEMLARWVGEAVGAVAQAELGGTVSRVGAADSYSCRNRNQAASGRMSEHALGHAVDIASLTIAGRIVPMSEPIGANADETAFRAAIRRSACSYFTTVLGPGSDAAHKDHMHLDVMARPSGYRLCQ